MDTRRTDPDTAPSTRAQTSTDIPVSTKPNVTATGVVPLIPSLIPQLSVLTPIDETKKVANSIANQAGPVVSGGNANASTNANNNINISGQQLTGVSRQGTKRKRFRRRGPGILGEDTDLHRRLTVLIQSQSQPQPKSYAQAHTKERGNDAEERQGTSPGKSSKAPKVLSFMTPEKSSNPASSQKEIAEKALDWQLAIHNRLEKALGTPQKAGTILSVMGSLSPKKSAEFLSTVFPIQDENSNQSYGNGSTPSRKGMSGLQSGDTKTHPTLSLTHKSPMRVGLLKSPYPSTKGGSSALADSKKLAGTRLVQSKITDHMPIRKYSTASMPALLRRKIPPQVSVARVLRRYTRGQGRMNRDENETDEEDEDESDDEDYKPGRSYSAGGSKDRPVPKFQAFELLLGAAHAMSAAPEGSATQTGQSTAGGTAARRRLNFDQDVVNMKQRASRQAGGNA